MAFTYRPSEETEKILLDYMDKEDIRDKSKCVSFLINSRPALDKELAEKRKECNKRVAVVEKECERLNKEITRLHSLLISEETGNRLDFVIKDLKKFQKDIINWKKTSK